MTEEIDMSVDEAREKLRDLNYMTRTSGWKIFIEIMAAKIESHQQEAHAFVPEKIDDIVPVTYRKGYLDGLKMLQNIVQFVVDDLQQQLQIALGDENGSETD